MYNAHEKKGIKKNVKKQLIFFNLLKRSTIIIFIIHTRRNRYH